MSSLHGTEGTERAFFSWMIILLNRLILEQ